MKVRIPGTNDCAKCRENLLNEYQYEVFANCIDSAACSALAMAIRSMEMTGLSENTIKEFIRNYFFVAETNKVFNREIRAEDAMKLYSERYGVDFDKLSINIETKAHFMSRYRRETKEDVEDAVVISESAAGVKASQPINDVDAVLLRRG